MAACAFFWSPEAHAQTSTSDLSRVLELIQQQESRLNEQERQLHEQQRQLSEQRSLIERQRREIEAMTSISDADLSEIRGAGRTPLARIPYFAEQAIEFLKDFEQIILVGAQEPVAFFAYPGVPSLLAPPDCAMMTLAGVHDDIPAALAKLATRVTTAAECPRQPRIVPSLTGTELSPGAIADVISAGLPENAIISDEGITCAQELFLRTGGAPAHDWISVTGGSIGQGLPVSFGASIACPDRKVVAFQADGSAMYTVQSLWSMARERSDVTVVLLNNSSYAILNVELTRLKAGDPNPKTLSMLDLGNPVIDWVSIAQGMQVDACKVETVAEFESAFAKAMNTPGPHLIEVMVVQNLGVPVTR